MVTEAVDNRVWLTPAHLTKQGRQGQAGSGTHHDCTAYPVGLVRGSGFNKFLSNTNSKTFPGQGFHSFLGYTVQYLQYITHRFIRTSNKLFYSYHRCPYLHLVLCYSNICRIFVKRICIHKIFLKRTPRRILYQKNEGTVARYSV
jgi:hypothetical protein